MPKLWRISVHVKRLLRIFGIETVKNKHGKATVAIRSPEANRAARAKDCGSGESQDDRAKPKLAPRRAGVKKAERFFKLCNKRKIVPCMRPLRIRTTRDESRRAKFIG